MSFLQPILLVGLPLALLPVLIHLINQHRHRTVKWAAMMFLLDAKKMTKGMARLRQILILAMRVIAVAAIVLVAGRPLAGGWLGFAGGKADTVLVLLDRSASMEQQNLETGLSKREAALGKIAELVESTGHRGEIVLIDSATLEPIAVTDPSTLPDLPQAAPTATSSDIPALLDAALAWLETDESGRTDIWLATDLRQNDFDPGSARWQTIRADLAARDTVRLFVLSYPATNRENFSVSVERVERKREADGFRLVMDLTIRRGGGSPDESTTIPVEFTVNGTRTVEEMVVSGEETIRLGHSLTLGAGDTSGWGRVDLPGDDNPADNSAFFVFGEPGIRRTVIVSDDPLAAGPIRAAAAAAIQPGITHEASIVSREEASSLPWESTALVFWHAPLPASGTPEAALLRQHAEQGRSLILLPPEDPGEAEWSGFRWGDMQGEDGTAIETGWWSTESGLLANTRDGEPLPVGDLSLFRIRTFEAEHQALLKTESGETVVAKLLSDTAGSIHVWATLPRSDWSTLASEGVSFFAMIHRALEEGAATVSPARSVQAGSSAVRGDGHLEWLSSSPDDEILARSGLIPAAFEIEGSGGEGNLVAVVRPPSEDDIRTLSGEALDGLLEGVDYRRIEDEVDSGSSLASEIWKVFLVMMALALLLEAALCLPPRSEA